MKLDGLSARKKRRFVRTTDSSHSLPIAANVVNQDFEAPAANRIWASDITYVSTDQGWLYLSVVMDLFSRRIIGWSMAESLVSSLVRDAIEMAALRRDCDGVIFHSDRGCQYASDDVRGLVSNLGMRPSMSRRGNCYDNAPVESFFGTLKTELVHSRRYSTPDEARIDIFDYIEVFYNRQRLHSSLGYQTPVDFEAAAML
jgi:transposase InsO family protein